MKSTSTYSNYTLLTHGPDWSLFITQQLKNTKKLDHIGIHEELGLLSLDLEIYFITKHGLKYPLSNEKVKMCVTNEDAYDWVKKVHEYKVPHLMNEEVHTQVHHIGGQKFL